MHLAQNSAEFDVLSNPRGHRSQSPYVFTLAGLSVPVSASPESSCRSWIASAIGLLSWAALSKRLLIMFRIGAMVWRSILGLAPAYLRDLCHPTPGTRGCSSLRSSEQGLLFVPFARTSTTQARAF